MLLVQSKAGPAPLAETCARLGYDVETTAETDVGALLKTAQAIRPHALYAADGAAWPPALAAAHALGVGRWLHDPDGERLRGAWQELMAAGIAVTETCFAPNLPAAEAGLDYIEPPCWLRNFAGSAAPRCLRLDHAEDLPLLFAKAGEKSPGKCVLLQKAPTGDLYRVVGFKLGRDYHPVEVIRERSAEGPYRVPAALTVGDQIAGAPYEAMLRLARRAAAALPPFHGPLEIELVLDDAAPILTDLRPQPTFSLLVEAALRLALGVNLREDTLRVAMGDAPQLAPVENLAAAVRMLDSHSGIVESVEGIEAARRVKNVRLVAVQAQPGDVVGHAIDEAAREQVGYVAAAGPSIEQAAQAAKAACGHIQIQVRPAEA